MESDKEVIEYRGGEAFRSRAGVMGLVTLFLMTASEVVLIVAIAVEIYIGVYLHPVEVPIWLLVLGMIIVLQGIWMIAYLARLFLNGSRSIDTNSSRERREAAEIGDGIFLQQGIAGAD